MADKEAIFKNLKDATDGTAKAADLALEGDVSSSNDGIGTLAFKDSSGNLVRPQLTVGGAIVTEPTGGGTCKQANGSLVEQGDTVLHDITGAVITLDASKVFEKIEWMVASGGPALFELVQDDNGSVTVISRAIVGAGQYTFESAGRLCKQVTAGATGTQELKIRAKHIFSGAGNQSDFYAELGGKQLA